MKFNYKILEHKITKDNIYKIDTNYNEHHLTYVIEPEDSIEHIYITKDILSIEENNLNDIVKKINLLNNQIIKKTIINIFKDKDCDKILKDKFKFSKDIIEVLKYDFLKEYKGNDIRLTHYGRFDLLLDNNNFLKVIEYNSETPAWLPESLFSWECLFSEINLEKQFYNFNDRFEYNLYYSLYDILIDKNYKEISVLFWKPDFSAEVDTYHEDYINSKHIAALLLRCLYKLWRTDVKVNLLTVDEINISWDAILSPLGVKQDLIWSFYPLEWIFQDWEAGKKFWNIYKNNWFNLINNPLNLISQNKIFWAYLWENINTFTQEEQEVIREIIPYSSYTKDYFEKENKEYFKKAILYREGVGINDENYSWEVVFQEEIKQKKISINTFYDSKEPKNNYNSYWDESKQNWYLTFWVYCWNNWVLALYNRFCERYITDDTTYYLPLLVEKKENNF